MREVETDLNKRWEQGIEHHPESEEIAQAIFDLDLKHGGDYFCWKDGGDGDNGEHLKYLLDIYFERKARGETEKEGLLKDKLSEHEQQKKN